MIKAVIFDLDGTIADTIDALKEAINITMSRLGYPLSTREDVIAHINFGVRHLVGMSLPKALQDDEDKVNEAVAVYTAAYRETYMHTDHPYDGIPEVIKKLHDAGYIIGVLSNKPHEFVENMIPALLPDGLCKVARGQIPGTPAKPDPTVPHEVCRALGVKPEECVLVGDSDVDMITAKNAGFFALGVSWGYRPASRLVEMGADAIANIPADIFDVIAKI